MSRLETIVFSGISFVKDTAFFISYWPRIHPLWQTDLGVANRAHHAPQLWSTGSVCLEHHFDSYKESHGHVQTCKKKCNQLVMSAMNAGTVPGLCYPFMKEQLNLYSNSDLIPQSVVLWTRCRTFYIKFTVHTLGLHTTTWVSQWVDNNALFPLVSCCCP